MSSYINLNSDVVTQNYDDSGLYAHVFDYYLSPIQGTTIYSSTHHITLRLYCYNGYSSSQLFMKEYGIGLTASQAKIVDYTPELESNNLSLLCYQDSNKFRFYVSGCTGISSPVRVQFLQVNNQGNIETVNKSCFSETLSGLTLYKPNAVSKVGEYTTYEIPLLGDWEFENAGRNRFYTINGVAYMDFSVKLNGTFSDKPFELPIATNRSKQFPIAYNKGGTYNVATLRIDGSGNATFMGVPKDLTADDYVVGSFFYHLF